MSRRFVAINCRIFLIGSFLLLGCFPLGCASDLQKRFQSHIDYLASDELEGRGIGSEGLQLAADYIAGQFELIGLEPAGDDGGWFQTFSMTVDRKLTDQCGLTVSGESTKLERGQDFIPFGFSSNDAFKGDVVFCGYGIVDSDRSHNDFVHLDLKGKIAIIVRGEPADWADEAGNATRNAMFRNKVYNAKDREASAVLIVNQAPEEGESDKLSRFVSHRPDAYGMPAFQITRKLAEQLLERGGLRSLDALQAAVDDGKLASAPLVGVSISGQAGFEEVTASTSNVVGRLPGVGPLAKEHVIIGAHYDHLGIRKPMMRRFRRGKVVSGEVKAQIHNGADDNASGVSGVIEAARILVAEPMPRTVLFIAFTGEEAGLHGSKYYVEHPIVPLDDTVAMLNLDMIGRMGRFGAEVQAFGAATSPQFDAILESAAKPTGIKAVAAVDQGGRSDHAPFIRSKIPSMHFYSGHHKDYHQPSDDSDKINAKGGAGVVRLVASAVRAIAERSDRVAFSEPKGASFAQKEGAVTSFKVVMGLAPSYIDDGKAGMKVDGISSEGPADMAGMRVGDRILRIGTTTVSNVYDYMAATRSNKAGDEVEVMVSRGGKEVALKVVLAPAG